MFDKKNPPKNFYVYIYVREDDTPYYVGKGYGIRAWVLHRRKNNTELRPSDLSRIRIVAHNLTEEESLLLEKKLISYYGLKSDNGILVNLNTGGLRGANVSKELRANLKLAHNNPSTLQKHKSASIAQWSDPLEREKLMKGLTSSESRIAKKHATKKSWEDKEIRNKRIASILATTSTSEYKIMRSERIGLKANNVDRTIYSFIHKSGIHESCTRIELSIKYQIDSRKIGDMVNGRKKTYKGWKLNV